ncbi:hypothetical protein, partial [Vibrio parahaemolyticus]|uniref:hypothetical protein n=1 Tax=Vibrio parahaemolyticus TaxID=670 RepID=UPI001C5E8890
AQVERNWNTSAEISISMGLTEKCKINVTPQNHQYIRLKTIPNPIKFQSIRLIFFDLRHTTKCKQLVTMVIFIGT